MIALASQATGIERHFQMNRNMPRRFAVSDHAEMDVPLPPWAWTIVRSGSKSTRWPCSASRRQRSVSSPYIQNPSSRRAPSSSASRRTNRNPPMTTSTSWGSVQRPLPYRGQFSTG